jgi:hypothetical protein
VLKQAASVKLGETLERLAALLQQARQKWSQESKRFQAAEKMFLAWRLAVKAAILAALLEAEAPEALLREIREEASRKRRVVEIEEGEMEVYVTTPTAPRLVRLLAESGKVPHDVRTVARLLQSVKEDSYRLHVYFYEGDPGAAGYSGEDELEGSFNRLWEKVNRVLGYMAEILR